MDKDDDLIPDPEIRKQEAAIVGDKMYGKNWEKILAGIKELDPNFASFIEEIPYGSIYPRLGLSLQYREIAAITMLTQLNLKPQLKSHILAAMKIGISKEEILELFLHITMFIGFPLVLDGLKVAKEVFDAKGI
ncbi:MAG: carboxymuconolactone decarboxylase family protein [Candidatus Kariarchaeaceae archaeon]